MNCKKMQGIFVLVVLAFNLPIATYAQEAIKRPVLHEFVTQTLEGHPSLLSTEASQRAVEARAQGKARSIYNPEIEIGYVNNRDREKEIGISQTIDWSGKRRARSKVGSAEIAASKSVYLLVKKDLIKEILQSLTEYQTASKIYKVAEDKTRLSEDFLNLAQRRNQAGELPRSELLTAMLALSESQSAKNKASNELSQSKENLIALVGEERTVWPNFVVSP